MDYDVRVLGLSSPPAAAVQTQYRPAVSVRNEGLHDTLVSGYIRIYSAGLLVFSSQIFSGTLSPGATGTADALDIWTPPAPGSYVVQAYATAPLDQDDSNNLLPPTTIVVAGGEPPPGPDVPLHAPQHEEGGADQLNVDGLSGVLAQPQTPSAHVASHQAGGSDQINVAGLAGVLASPQTPIVHSNAHHYPDLATADALDNHIGATTAHSAAANLANRETSGPDDGLVKSSQLANMTEIPADDREALLKNRAWGYPIPTTHGSSHSPGGSDPVSLAAVLPVGTIIIWDGSIPTPDGWTVEGVTPPLNIPYIHLRYVG